MESIEDPEKDYVYYGNALEPIEEDQIAAAKKPIRIEDQEVRDENGRRRFHGAFTGGFSAGYYNTVDTKEGWRPAEFKSSRSDRKKHAQKPEDFMDQEDLGSFGIAPQVLRAKDDFGEHQSARQRLKPVFATTGSIPGLPALHELYHPIKETIGIRLLRAMGWKPHQGAGARLTKKEKQERKKRENNLKAYGCGLPPGFSKEHGSEESAEEESDDDQLFAPDDLPTYIVQPKTNTFGLGYSGLSSYSSQAAKSTSTKSGGFVLFEPTLSLTDRKKKLQIAGQAFGVGAFEDEDEDIYSRDDMSQYDFVMGGSKSTKPDSNLLAITCSGIIEGFVQAAKPQPSSKVYPPPNLPKDFNPIHRSGSRFDVKPVNEAAFRGLGRHDLNAHQRAAILNEVLDMSSESQQKAVPNKETKPVEKPSADEIVAQALIQIRKNLAAQQAASSGSIPKATSEIVQPTIPDLQKETKIAALKEFVESSITVSTFRPFSRYPEKQFRFDAYIVLNKAKRLDEFHLLQPDSMTEWEREREKVEFERSIALYQPLTGTMQNRFTSGGHVEENIQGGLVAQIETFLPQELPQPKKEPMEKDPAKRAARRKQFGPLTRQRCQWKPDRLLCIRFNVPNPFPDAGAAQNSAKLLPKGSGFKFSIFDVLSGAGPSFVSTGFEIPGQPAQGPANKPPELEWEKAEKGELQEKAGVLVPDITTETEQPETETVKEEEALPPRPSMDIFKAIFANSDSEEEDEEEQVPEKSTLTKVADAEVPEPKFKREQLDTEEDTYGPKLPASSATSNKSSTFSLPLKTNNDDHDEWIEKKREKEAGKKKKNKKDKKSKKKKKEKRKRRHSDRSSSSEDEDVKILKKIAALKKQKKL